MKKVIAILMALCLGLGAFACVTCDAKGGGGRTSGYSRSAAPKASAPKASAPKGNTSGYKSSKSNSTSSAPKGSSYTTKKDGKVTSGGGNTSGYKSKQTQTKEQAQKNVAENQSNSSSSHWYGGTNNHYYDRDDSGIGGFATGMIFGSLLSSPWHVYAGAPGYVGSYGAAPGVAAAGGFYSPFAGFIGVIVWFIEWAFIIACIVLAVRFGRLWWRKRQANR